MMSKQQDKGGDVCLTLRKNGKYYQIGYYEKSKWIQVLQLGTAESLVRELNEARTNKENVPKH